MSASQLTVAEYSRKKQFTNQGWNHVTVSVAGVNFVGNRTSVFKQFVIAAAMLFINYFQEQVVNSFHTYVDNGLNISKAIR